MMRLNHSDRSERGVLLDLSSDAAIERLSAIDWEFKVRVVEHDVEGVHPYPAKFIADIPAAFLDALPVEPGTLLMDPFCGSGTTLAEGQRRGIQTVGVDLNPIACLIARVKTAPLSSTALQSAQRAIEHSKLICAPIPGIPNLGHWFKSPIQRELAALMQAINKEPREDRDFLRLAASSIIVRVSNQDSDTRYAAVEKKVSARDVPLLFMRASERLFSALSNRKYHPVPSTVIEADLLTFDTSALDRKVGMFITSPPYPNAYEYWLYHKYRMWWLGYDPIAVKDHEIGARAHFFKKNRHTAQTFVNQMTKAFDKMREVSAPGAWACFVVGRSKIHGEIVDNARIIEEAGYEAGFGKVFRTERTVLSTRKSFNLSHANIKTESIIVLRSDV